MLSSYKYLLSSYFVKLVNKLFNLNFIGKVTVNKDLNLKVLWQ